MTLNRAATRAPRRRGWIARLVRWGLLAALAALLVLASLLLLWRFVPPVSTLMLGRWMTLQQVERVWTPLERISPNLVAAVIASEDARFCSHAGVDWDALDDQLDAKGGPQRGASTITMQTAKNLFLWPQRSYIRKGLEIPIAMAIETAWPKRRVMEVYLNIAEWGPGLFGAEAAARRYFRKSAAQLTRREAALLATALPNPILRNPSRPSRRHGMLTGINIRRAASAGPLIGCVKN